MVSVETASAPQMPGQAAWQAVTLASGLPPAYALRGENNQTQSTLGVVWYQLARASKRSVSGTLNRH